MVLSITGIIINVVMVIIIIIIIIFGVMYNGELHTCETKQSNFCYNIQCPCDSSPGTGRLPPPCFGYAKMPAQNEGQWFCSSAPLTLVDNSGNPV